MMNNVIKFPTISLETAIEFTEDEFINELNGCGYDDSEFKVTLTRLIEDDFGDKGGWVFMLDHPEENKLCILASNDGEGCFKQYTIDEALKLIEKLHNFDELSFSLQRNIIDDL